MSLTVLSWNVNGLRAAAKKGFVDWLTAANPDIIGLQETKASPEQLPEAVRQVPGYHVYFNTGERKGYSGTALYTKQQPSNVSMEFGVPEFDCEGRMLIADYGAFVLMNIYYPNGQSSAERLDYKMRYYDTFLDVAEGLRRQGRNLLIGGDVNTAHREIDLARPGPNSKISGFLPQERAWLDKFLGLGYVDTFRMFSDEPGQYTYWDTISRARERNMGWRIDYFFVNEEFKDKVKRAWIMADVMGSDHCPIGVELDV